MISQLYWQLELAGCEKYPAIQRIKEYGWRDNESLFFCKAVEIGSTSLLDLLVKSNLEARVPGAARLLTARCLLMVMNTADNMISDLNLLPIKVTFENLYLRASLNSGFLKELQLVQAAPAKALIDMWPYYP